jgi:hypothetical protein
MANLFDPANSPTTEPKEVVVGDFIQWRRIDLQDYDNSLYTMTYVARITGGGVTEIQLPGTAYGSDYLFSVSSVDSADFVAGYYHWQLEAVRDSDGERVVVDRGYFTAIADLDVNGADPRSHAEIMIDKIESLLEGKADSDVANYEIAGRKLTKLSFKELMEARDYYRSQLMMEQRAFDVKQGKPTNGTVKVRF